MKSLVRKSFNILLLVALTAGVSGAAAPTPMVPGDLHRVADTWKIAFENGVTLWWPEQGPLQIKDAQDRTLFKVDLKAKVHRPGGAEAMGLEVEEADLGGSGNSKKYLKGKKIPKGRALDPRLVQKAPEESLSGQESKSEVAGIPMLLTKYPNGSYALKFEWGKTSEEVFFDRRQTLIRVQQARQIEDLHYTIRQWGDGSFVRIFKRKAGEVRHTYDAQVGSYRFLFVNAEGKGVREIYCDPDCKAEN